MPSPAKFKKRIVRRIFKCFAVLAILGVVGIGVLLGSFWLEHRRELTLLTPTGSFAVGRALYDWVDDRTLDPLAPVPGTKRELLVWIWYPAAARRPFQTVDYLPARWRAAVKRQMGVLLTQFLTRDLARVHVHSIRDAEVSPQQRSHPVILMRAGLAALTTDYTTLAEDLASHGYVVVGLDAPYRSFVVVLHDGTVIPRAPQNNAEFLSGVDQEKLAIKLVQAWSADMSFVLDRLELLNSSDPSGKFQGRLDMRRVGVFGHSLGGATALQFCHNDSRCKAGIDVDGAPLGSVVTEGVTQPFMFLLSDHSREPDAETRPVKANIRSIYDHLRSDRRLEIVIRGANHFGFRDENPLPMRVMNALGIMRLDGRRQLALTAHYIDTFFDVYLKGAPASELEGQPTYPEIDYVH